MRPNQGDPQSPNREQRGQQRQPPQGGRQSPPGGAQQTQPPQQRQYAPQQGGQAPPQPPQQWQQPPQTAPPQTGQPQQGMPPQQFQQGAPPQGGQLQQQQPMQPPGGGQPMQQAQAGPGGRARQPLQPVPIDEIVQTDVVTVERDASVADAVSKMAAENVGSVVIVEDNAPVGILTDRKIALALENTPDIVDSRAEDLISDELVTGTVEMSVFDALQRLEDEGIRRLPIVDEEGALQGIVTLDDVLVLLGTELSKATGIISQQSRSQ